MPAPVLDRIHRNSIHMQLGLDLTEAGDLPIAFHQDELDTAQAIRRRLEQAFRLLDDVGWSFADRRTSFTLTAPPAELRATILRLRGEAGNCLEGVAPIDTDYAIRHAHSEALSDACSDVLVQLES
jgi:hypothetical protein